MSQPPAWFTGAVAQEPEIGIVDVDGISIALRSWGTRGDPGIVLVHGGAAHAGWWDHVAPFLARRHRVVALDLSGHGDSGRRETYGLVPWSAEVLAVIDASDFAGAAVVVGHSMGGWVSMAAAQDDSRVSGLMVIDSPLISRSPEQLAAAEKHAFGPLKLYATVDDAVGRFRTVPAQPDSLPYVVDRIARQSLRAVDGGFSWKFDRRTFGNTYPSEELLRAVRCRAAIFRAEHGLVTAAVASDMYELFGRTAPVIEIPVAGHHVMLDQPLPLVAGILTLLGDWEHSDPRAGASDIVSVGL